MTAIVETREPLEEPVDMERVQADIDLRIRAGAIRCHIDGEPPDRVLVTEWNVLGEND